MKALNVELKEVIENDNLPFLTKLSFGVKAVTSPNVNNYSFRIMTTEQGVVEILGDGHFTDGTMTQDLGKIASSWSNQKYSNGNYKILLPLTGLVEFHPGSVTLAQCTDWQVNDLDIQRLVVCNKDTLTTIGVTDINDLYDTILDTVNVTGFILVPRGNGTTSIKDLIEKLVEQDGRTVNFYIRGRLIKDEYGGTTGSRNVHIVIPNSKFEVYNEANTTLLYTAIKGSSGWEYTMA